MDLPSYVLPAMPPTFLWPCSYPQLHNSVGEALQSTAHGQAGLQIALHRFPTACLSFTSTISQALLLKHVGWNLLNKYICQVSGIPIAFFPFPFFFSITTTISTGRMPEKKKSVAVNLNHLICFDCTCVYFSVNILVNEFRVKKSLTQQFVSQYWITFTDSVFQSCNWTIHTRKLT